MRFLTATLVLLAALVATSALADSPPPLPQVTLRLPAGVTPTAQRLELELDPRRLEYRGLAEIDVSVTGPHPAILLNARDLTITAASIAEAGSGKSDQKARVTPLDPKLGVIALEVARPVQGALTLSISFHAPLRPDLTALYRVEQGGAAYVFSQFEPLAARQAFPCFDEPGFKIPWEVTITHHPDDTALFNTRPIETAKEHGLTRVKFARTQPLPTYLLAFVVGPVDVVDGPVLPPTLDRKAPLPMRAIGPRGTGPRLGYALNLAAAVIIDQEKVFGLGYPYDKLDLVAVPDFSAGAMENAGLVTFRDTLLMVDERSPIGLQKGSLDIIAHELAHQWFGNLVTMGFWDDLWLNEAFATWFAGRTSQRLRPAFDGDFELLQGAGWAMQTDSLSSARRIREPIVTRGDIDNAFDTITYQKGGGVIAMFEHFIDRLRGPGTFMRGVTAYLTAHRHGTGTTADFLLAVSKAANLDVAPAFKGFLDQSGVPLLKATCVDGNPADRPAQVRFETTRYLPVGSKGTREQKWSFPVCVALPGAKAPVPGAPSDMRCVLLENGAGLVPLDTPKCPAAVHPNADARGYYLFTMPPAQLAGLGRATRGMTPGDRFAFAAAVNASFSAASVPFADALAAADDLAKDEEPAVAAAPLAMLRFARDRVVETEAARERVNARIVALYGPVLERLGYTEREGEHPRVRELRRTAFSAVVGAQGPSASKVAIAAGRELFEAATTALAAPDLWSRAMVAAVEDGAPEPRTWEKWLTAARAQPDRQVQEWMLQALTSTRNPALSPKALALSLDEGLSVNQRFIGIGGQATDRRTADAAFQWFLTHGDAFSRSLPEEWRQYIVTLFDGECRPEVATRLEAQFRPRVATTPGLERLLAQTVENITLCVARRDAHAKSIRGMFR